MGIVDEIRSDVNDAMRAGERERVGALRFLLSELQKALKEGQADEVALLRRERKRRLDAAAAYREGGREDLAGREERESELIAAYLPAELSDDELHDIVAQAVRDTGSTSAGDMGRVMKQAMGATAGRADGARVSALVRAALGA
jgi:uncharacterized protein YqeY